MTFITLPFSSGNRPPLYIRPDAIEFLLQEENGTLLNVWGPGGRSSPQVSWHDL
ncbi:hypothetical protein [Sorangium sp. So ce1024]|uniref:hypothetical protein n=1 Tax=unclassified Sorangium TaxID=2621164 RepID=UPI003F0F6EDB